MDKRVIFETDNKTYRIVEMLDLDADIENLKGDCFNPKYIKEMNPGMTLEQLREEELRFERDVSEQGVFGYALEKWNPAPDCGWEHVDSCWGFVGAYDEESETYDHYIVEEMKQIALKAVSNE